MILEYGCLEPQLCSNRDQEADVHDCYQNAKHSSGNIGASLGGDGAVG